MSSRSSSNFNLSFTGYHRVGFVKSAHGIRGELFIGLFAGRADWEAETLFLLLPDATGLKEYAIEKSKPHKDGLIVELDGVSTRNEAELLRKAAVFVSEDVLTSEPGEPIFLGEIEGFDLVSKDDVVLGKITGFSSNGPQDLLKVETPKGERLVPFIDEFIVDIDFDNERVRMDLPPGLIDEDA